VTEATFDYPRYLASREWAQRKEAVRRRARGICERCDNGPMRSVHHLTYEHVGCEPLEDLLGVCNPCHNFLSAKSDFDPKSSPPQRFVEVKVPTLQALASTIPQEDDDKSWYALIDFSLTLPVFPSAEELNHVQYHWRTMSVEERISALYNLRCDPPDGSFGSLGKYICTLASSVR
jgi:hypothetical protein